jgi:hypothetical protein
VGAYLFGIPGHKIVPAVKVMQCGVAVHLAVGGNTLVVQYPVSSLQLIVQKMHFIAGG